MPPGHTRHYWLSSNIDYISWSLHSMTHQLNTKMTLKILYYFDFQFHICGKNKLSSFSWKKKKIIYEEAVIFMHFGCPDPDPRRQNHADPDPHPWWIQLIHILFWDITCCQFECLCESKRNLMKSYSWRDGFTPSKWCFTVCTDKRRQGLFDK